MSAVVSTGTPPAQTNEVDKPNFEDLLKDKHTQATDSERPAGENTAQKDQDTQPEEEAGMMLNPQAVLQNQQVILAEQQMVQPIVQLEQVVAVSDEAAQPVIEQTMPEMATTTQEQTTGQEAMNLETVPTTNTAEQADLGNASQQGEQDILPDDVDAEVTRVTDNQPKALFEDVKAVPVKVGDNATLDTTSAEFGSKLGQQLTKAVEGGQQQVILQLTPENLGKVVVEINLQGGILNVVMQVENDQALRLLSEQSSLLGGMLQNNGQEVRIEVERSQQGEQPWQHPDQKGGQHGRQQEGKQEQTDPEDFLQRLRLGLFDGETETA